jgi:hypothetical protein
LTESPQPSPSPQPNVLPSRAATPSPTNTQGLTGFTMPPNGILTQGDNLAGKFGLPGLQTPAPVSPNIPPTQSPTRTRCFTWSG